MATDTLTEQFAADVVRGLQQSPKQLPSQYLYDALGSALFEAICRLPWYRITRAEAGLLSAHSRAIVSLLRPADSARGAAPPSQGAVSLIELGVGNGEKLATIVEAVAAPVRVHIIDISDAALDETAARLAGVPGVSIVRHPGTYDAGLAAAARARAGHGPALALFLGSNIGNFDETGALDLLDRLRAALAPGDLLLLGADLVKPVADLVLAYDDPLGVTAAFNRNLLVRLNRELGGGFDLDTFAHRAVWNEDAQRIEMHLVSTVAQEVPVAGIRVRFAAGESVWTESSYKYTDAGIIALGRRAGFAPVDQWIDRDAQFGLTLLTTGEQERRRSGD